MNRYGLENDPGFVQGEWKYGDTVYKKAPTSIYTGAPFGADQTDRAVQVIYMDGPEPAPKYIFTPNTENNTVEITVDAYTTYNFYVVSEVEFLGTDDGASETPVGAVTGYVAEIQGMENPTTILPVIATSNGTYKFAYTVKRQGSDDPIDSIYFEGEDYDAAVDMFHTVTYVGPALEVLASVPVDNNSYVPGFEVTAARVEGLVEPAGKKFLGWTYEVNETVTNEAGEAEETTREVLVQPGDKFAMPDTDVTLTETWLDVSDAKITVTFHAGDGATFGTGADLILYGKIGDSLAELLGNYRPVKTGYKLIGWKDSEAADEFVTEVPNVDVNDQDEGVYDVYAAWEIVTTTVQFKANQGRFTSEDADTVFTGEYNTEYTTPAVERAGYTFEGWNTKANGTGTTLEISDTGVARFPAERTTYYAQWKAAFHDVTFAEGNHGTITSGTTVIPHVATESVIGLSTGWNEFILPSVVAEDGYRFIGWMVNGDEKLYVTQDDIRDFVIGTEDVVFVAQYELIPYGTIRFDYNGGKDVAGNTSSTAEGEVGTVIPAGSIPGTLARNGYKFVGWTLDGEVCDTFNLQFAEGTITVVAAWEEVSSDQPDTPPSPPVKPDPTPDPIPSIFTEDHVAYMNGVGNGRFSPDGSLTRAQAAQILFNLLKDEEKNVEFGKSFSDVKDGDWFYQPVMVLAAKNIIKGYPDGTFKPEAKITKAEFVALCARFFTLEGTSSSYNDVANHWASKFIISAEAKGWLSIYTDAAFEPNAVITRKEVVSITNKVFRRTPDKAYIDAHAAELKTFSDVDASNPFYYDIMEAANAHDAQIDADGVENWGAKN